MAVCSLTDDEKEKLASILKEMNDDVIDEESLPNSYMEVATITEISSEVEENEVDEEGEQEKVENAFKLFSEEVENIKSINARLELLQHSRYNDGKEQSIDNNGAVEVTDLEERKWKEQLLMNRLKCINKELRRIARENKEEEEEMEEENSRRKYDSRNNIEENTICIRESTDNSKK